jgi:cobalamin 5'-phosphate synthase/cobalamin synthase
MHRLLLALQLLTRIPVPVRGEVSARDLGASTAFFPAVGAVQGLLACGAALLLLRLYPPAVVGAAVVALLAAVSGGLHLDGLADTFDALGVKATGDAARDRERRLAAMRDSAIGAMGTIAICLALLLKTLLAGSLLAGRPLAAACAALFLAPVGSKWAMVVALRHGEPARPDGLGRAFGEHCTGGALLLALALGCALFAAAWRAGGRGATLAGAAVGAAFLAGIYLAGRAFVLFCGRRFGGVSGDTVGALGEIVEILLLATAVPWLRHSI